MTGDITLDFQEHHVVTKKLLLLTLKINSSTGKKKKLILTESNETYTECSRLQINDMCQTILEENVYWLSNEHRKTRKPR